MSAAATNFFSIVSDYVDNILPPDNTMKVLMVDADTLNIISMACSHTFLLSRGVFLVALLGKQCQRRRMKNLRCIAFVRPQAANIEKLCEELCDSKYASYSVFFIGAVDVDLLRLLANADVNGLVNQVCEVFCDFLALNTNAFVSAVSTPNALIPTLMSPTATRTIAEGIASMFVAQRRRPLIRYDQNSIFCQRLAMDLSEILGKNPELYDYKSKDSMLLLLDRNSDALTPLVIPWTYQAMLHEHIGIHNNRLRLQEVNNQQPQEGEVEEYVFSQNDDPFFAANMFANWGDLCNNVKEYVDKCKSTLNIDRSTATMEEIKDFMQRLPQAKSLTGSVAKHATVVSQLSSHISNRNLLDTSLLEQHMIASPNQADHWNRIQELANNQHVDGSGGNGTASTSDLLRLCLIYHLRYEKPQQPSRVAELLNSIGAGYESYLRKLQQYCKGRNVEEFFGETGVMASIVKNFAGVGNIYTQHEPVLKRTLLHLFSGRLSAAQYPYLTAEMPGSPRGHNVSQQLPPQLASFKPKDVTVFMCGGFTYEEAALANAINTGTAYTGSTASNFPQGGVHVAIGGTGILNSQSFLSLLSTHP
ncbi:putative vacuolar protein sorting-associated protein 45-like protein [Trypanosoma vivax]|uniref:Putative vacuolar protein sorting-associated protein 45-like protein n=1 Tax=Trypanosoma vivax (strain Y486) TaxID=1055687 RepID=G0U6X2_TRYVY|nr:putative vacuolar protein sorting-associated protein 45-like protein [Trypanosoma vivax]CCC51628.1 putative vacuolar protein sorting-associated protein 45-like protein [Trypanosoma vivax Y486]